MREEISLKNIWFHIQINQFGHGRVQKYRKRLAYLKEKHKVKRIIGGDANLLDINQATESIEGHHIQLIYG